MLNFGMRRRTPRRIEHAAIEYNLTEHCNLTCGHCDHASPLLPKKLARLTDFTRDLQALAKVLHAAELRIVGGEPTLHPQIIEFLQESRRTGVAEKIKVYTNGTRLHLMPDVFWDAIDALELSAYPGVHIRMSRAEIEGICEKKKIDLNYHFVDGFFLSLLNQPIDDPGVVQEVFDACKNAHVWSCHAVYEGRFYKCSIAPFQEQRLASLGIKAEIQNKDGVQLHDNPNLREDLEQYLADKTPLRACTWCLGSSGPTVEHRQLNKAGRQAWLDEDHRSIIAAWRPPG
jgi:hypothetical protein